MFPRKALSATLVTVALGSLGCAGVGAAERDPDGPMRKVSPHGSATTLPVQTVFTDGLEVLQLKGEEDATIEGVELIDSEGFELLGAKLAPPDREAGAIQIIDSWPPVDRDLDESTLVEAVGQEVTPIAQDPGGWELLIGLRVVEEGHLLRSGIRVLYEVDGEDYVLDIPAEFTVCTDSSYEVDGQCPYLGEGT